MRLCNVYYSVGYAGSATVSPLRKGLLVVNSENGVSRAGVASDEMQKVAQNYGLVFDYLAREAICCWANSDRRGIVRVLVIISDVCMLLLRGLCFLMNAGWVFML